MLYDFTAFANFANKVESDPHLYDLISRYDEDPSSLTDEERNEMINSSFDDLDYPEDDYYEDWDNLEMGFDPYMGCYSDDC